MILRRIMQVSIVTVAVLAVCAAAVRVYPPTVLAAFAAVGRGPAFPLSEVMRAAERRSTYSAAMQDLRAVSRITPVGAGLQAVETPSGLFLEPRVSGSNVLGQLAELKSKYSGVAKAFVQPGDVVLDCGANVGVFTRAALSAGAAQVVAIEPSPRNLACLRKNLANEIAGGRVIVAPVGVWDTDDTLTLIESDAPPEDGFVRSASGHKGVAVPLTTIDKLVRKFELRKVDFIKLDIEGAEQRALAGAQVTIATYRPALEISVNHLPEDPEQVPALVLRAWPGYRVQMLTCHVRRPDWRLKPEILLFDSRGAR